MINNMFQVLLVGGQDFTAIGRPIIPNSYVTGTVCEQKRAKHVIVFKKKRRKGYKRTRGHRQLQTVVRIDDIDVNRVDFDSAQNEKVVAVE
jgi:large subunit ribosomal protein L21